MTWNVTLLWRFFTTAVVLSALSAGIGCLLVEVWWLGLLFILLGLGWWFNHFHQRLAENIPFILFLAAAAYAGFRGAAPFWLLVSGTFALIAWDLDHFMRQLKAGMLIFGEGLMVKAHCRQLAQVAGISFMAGTAALLIEINFSFAAAFILAFLAIWGLSFLLRQVVN